jgi:hypothetical protein
MRRNLNKTNHSNYQLLYLWTRFLLGMISLGIFVWQRSSQGAILNSAVIPSGTVIPSETRDLLPSHFMEVPHYVRDDNYVVAYSIPLILSALTYQQTNNAMSGLLFGLASYISSVNSQATSAITINLNNLESNEGIIFTGGASTGGAVYAADFNKDGNMDLLIGTSAYSATTANKVYLVYGPNFNVTNLDSLTGTQGMVFNGSPGTGLALYAADINNDTNIDIFIGAYTSNKIYLLYGPTFNISNLDNLSGSQGVIFTGGQYTGVAVRAADLNRDGNMDILIGAYGANKVYLLYGPIFNVTNLDNLSGSTGMIFTGGVSFGNSIQVADMNRDGNVDILVGASSASKVYLAYGPIFNVTNLDSLNGQQGIIFTGGNAVGSSIYAADMNRDGNMDVLIDDWQVSKMYLVYGPFNVTNINNLNGQQGVVLAGAAGTGLPLRAADFNQDGNPDIFVGAYGSATTYLVYGPNFANATNLQALTLKQGVIFNGATTRANYAADVDNDGNLDVIIGGEGNNKVYVVYNPVFNVLRPAITLAPTPAPSPSVLTTTPVSITTPTTSLLTDTLPQETTNTLPTTSAAVTLSNVATTRGSIFSTATTQTSVAVVGKTTLSSETISESSSRDNVTTLPAGNSNGSNYTTIGVAAGSCVAGTILGAVGLFAVNKCRKKKANPNNVVAMKDMNENNQASTLERNSGTTVSLSQYETATVATNRYSEVGLQHQDRQLSSANTTTAQKNYVEIDETKKTEKQYENTPTFEL